MPSARDSHRGAASVAIRPLVVGARAQLIAALVGQGVAHLAAPDTGQIVLAVLGPRAVTHPHAVLVTDLEPFARLRRDATVIVGEGRVVLPTATVTVGRWWSPSPRLGRPSAQTLAHASQLLVAALDERHSRLPDGLASRTAQLEAALDTGDHDAVTNAAGRLLGFGEGSTPSGDDFLAGLIATHALLGHEATAVDDVDPDVIEGGIRHGRQDSAMSVLRTLVETRATTATTALSAVLLRHALLGQVCGPAAAVLTTLLRAGVQLPQASMHRGPDAKVTAVLEQLLAVGSSSGRDLAHGIALGLRVAARTIDERVLNPELEPSGRVELLATGRT